MSKYELMAKYLAGECTEAQSTKFETWLAAKTENKAAFEAQKLIWDEAGADQLEIAIDVEVGLKKLHQSIGSSVGPSIHWSIPWLIKNGEEWSKILVSY